MDFCPGIHRAVQPSEEVWVAAAPEAAGDAENTPIV